MDPRYLQPYHHQHGRRDDERLVELYPDEPGRHRHHSHHDDSLPQPRMKSESEHRLQRPRDDTDELGSHIRRSRSVVRHDHDHDRPQSRGHSRTSSRGGHSFRRPHSEDPAARKRYEHAIEKAIGAGSAAAFHVRHSEGPWVGAKGLKVVAAASAAALIDYAFDKDPKHHKTRHVALSMIQGAMVDAIVRSGEEDHDGHDYDNGSQHDQHNHRHHHREWKE